jgi:pilus assembly protein CpaD
MRKDSNMRSKLSLLALATALGACSYTPHDLADRGMSPVNVPVVERADYVLDVAAPGGVLPAGEAERLSGWFQGLGLSYGDRIFVDGPYSDAARSQVAQVAARYGLLVEANAPITEGALPHSAVRVVVSRTRATVPNCPNWRRDALPNYNNRSFSNFGCAVNSNLAAIIANPEDLIHGREGDGLIDPRTGTKAVDAYRGKALSGASGAVQAVSSKEN